MTRATPHFILVGLLAVLVQALPARAEEAPAAPKAYAVFIGISNYADKSIKPRPHAEDDAKALYEQFTNKEYLGVEKDNARLLLGADATKEKILKAVTWLAEQAKPDDTVLFGFFGQGAAVGERGDRIVYFAADSTVKDATKDAIPASVIGDDLEKLKSHKAAFFVDVYFKGYTPTAGGAPLEPNPGNNFFREFLGKDGTEEEGYAPGRVLFLATNGRHLSPDADKHGVFTQALLDGLQGKADKEGYEADGVITVDELTEYLNKELPTLVKKFATEDKDKVRHVVIAGDDAHLILGNNPAVVATVKKRLDKFADLAKTDTKLTPEIVNEGKLLLRRMPKLEAQRELRKKYQELADGSINTEKFLEGRGNILDGTKLSKAVATEFAEKVLDATELIRKGYVKVTNQGQMVDWAIRGIYRRIDEKVPEDVVKKLAGVKDMSKKELLTLLQDVRMRLGKREDLAQHKDIDIALQRMLSHLDPYTTFYSPEELEREKSQIQGNFIGVGIQIRKDPNTDMLEVITPILGSPAFKAGIQTGDIITTITREVDNTGKPLDPPEVISTKGLDISDAVKKILGVPKTKVKITVKRPGEEKPIEFEMERARVQVETVLGVQRKPDASWDFWVDPDNKIGYIRLTQFVSTSFPDMKKAIAAMKKEGIKGLVLDLRFNPGGLLTSARDVSDLFIDDGLIVSIRPRVGKEDRMYGTREGSYTDFPMVCMVNGMSASGSEIVAACLQDHHRAVILGERSYGKGSVQNVVPFELKENGRESKSEIKLTTATYWRPSGKNINKSSTSGKDDEEWGVTPDKGYVIPLSRAERDDLFEAQRNREIIRAKASPPSTADKPEFKDKQLDSALEYLRGQIKLAAKGQEKKAG